MDTNQIKFGFTLLQCDLVLTNYTCYDLFPNNVIFWGTGDYDANIGILEVTIQPITHTLWSLILEKNTSPFKTHTKEGLQRKFAFQQWLFLCIQESFKWKCFESPKAAEWKDTGEGSDLSDKSDPPFSSGEQVMYKPTAAC